MPKYMYKPLQKSYTEDLNDLVEVELQKGGPGSGRRGHKTPEKLLEDLGLKLGDRLDAKYTLDSIKDGKFVIYNRNENDPYKAYEWASPERIKQFKTAEKYNPSVKKK